MKHKNWKNKLLSALMAAVMTLSLLPATALAVTVDDTYTPGTYNGTATGFKGDVTVTVTLDKDGENTVISNIAATGEKETSDRWENAVKILDTIKTNNSTDGLTEKLNNKEIDAVSGATISATKTACTASTAYKEALAAKRTLSRNGVPQAGRWMIVSPEYLELLMQDDRFIKQGDLSQQLVQLGHR